MFCFNPFAKKNATLEKLDFFYEGKNSKKLGFFMKEFAVKKKN